jgi:hypothetical protein
MTSANNIPALTSPGWKWGDAPGKNPKYLGASLGRLLTKNPAPGFWLAKLDDADVAAVKAALSDYLAECHRMDAARGLPGKFW